MPRPPFLIAVAAAVVLATVVTFVVLGDLDESAGREAGVTLSEVSSDPGRYEGREVTVSGEIAGNEYLTLADADLAVVLGDDADSRLLVLPGPDAMVPRDLTENAVLRVRGEVEVVGAVSGRTGGEDFLMRGDVLAESGAEAVIRASVVERTRKEPGPPATPAPVRATVGQILDDPRAFDDVPVIVPGRAYPIGRAGFLLTDGRTSIFVGAPATRLPALEGGERVQVRAEVKSLSPFRADTIARALSDTPETAAALPDGAPLAETPIAKGDAFLVFRAFEAGPTQ